MRVINNSITTTYSFYVKKVRHQLAPGEYWEFPAKDQTEVEAAVDAIDDLELDLTGGADDLTDEMVLLADLKQHEIDKDTLIRFGADSYSGTADGSTPTEVDIFVAGGYGVPNPFTDKTGVTVAVTGSAVIAETMPVPFEEVRVGGKLYKKATINVTNAVAELVTLSLVDSESTGLDVTDAADITFS